MTNELLSYVILVRIIIYSYLPNFSVIGSVYGFNYEEKFSVGGVGGLNPILVSALAPTALVKVGAELDNTYLAFLKVKFYG